MKTDISLRPRRPSHLAIAKMLAAMRTEPQTIADLVYVTGLNATTVRGYVLAFRRERGLVHLAEWHEDKRGRLTSPAYRLGTGADASPPPKQRGALRSAKSRERKRQMQMLAALTGRLRQPATEAA